MLPFAGLIKEKGDNVDAKQKSGLSRRDFLKGVSAASVAVGIGSVAGFSHQNKAFAQDANSENQTDTNPYIAALGDNTNVLPVYKATWNAIEGPIGFENREIAPEEISHTDECDFLIIGCGIGGMMAILKGAEEGADVIGIEKMTRGRNSWESIGGCGTRFQKENDNTPDPAQYVEEILRAAYWRARPDVVWSFVNNSGETINFMQDMLDKSGWGIQIYNTKQADGLYGLTTIQGEHKFELPEEFNWTSWMYGPPVMNALVKAAETYSNIELRFETSGVQLVQNDQGRVTGAIVKDTSGYYQINASKGVLLATGGYEANPRMMESWTRPEDYASSSCWDPCQGPTGDGHMMGLRVGAQMDPIPHPVMNFNYGTPAQFLDLPGIWTCAQLGIHVNSSGKRFVNEGLQMNFISNAINAQPKYGQGCWIIFDQNMLDVQTEQNPTASDTISQYLEKGWLYQADSLSQLADLIGINPESLEETVTTYNSYFESNPPGDLEFRRILETTFPISKAPYFALTTRSTVLTVVGGLTINEHAQVLDTEENVIKGLYATGNASGGMFSGTYPRHLPATSVGRAATFGFVAARHAIKGE